MRIPLGATQKLLITHVVRKGTTSESYTVTLSGVSCHEETGVRAEAPGFARQSTSFFCIFPGHTTAAPAAAPEVIGAAGSLYLNPAAFHAAAPALRGCRWTLAPEDKVQLPSGRTGTVTRISDNRDGRCPHWYVEVSG